MRPSKKIKNTSKNHKTGKYKVVFLDWNGTLSASKFWGHLENQKPDIFQTIEKTLFGRLRSLIKPWMRGEIKSEGVMRKIADASWLDYYYLFGEFVRSCINMEYVSKDIPKIVKELRNKGVKVVVATDNMDSFNRWTMPYMKNANIFDDNINSFYKNGMKKDIDKEGKSIFFSEYINEHSLKPGESVLIDDSPDDIETIEGFGINYVHIKPVSGTVPALRNILATY